MRSWRHLEKKKDLSPSEVMRTLGDYVIRGGKIDPTVVIRVIRRAILPLKLIRRARVWLERGAEHQHLLGNHDEELKYARCSVMARAYLIERIEMN